MNDAIHDAEHLAMIATATAELEQLQEQAETVLERARPALVAFHQIANELDNEDVDEWDLDRAGPFYRASGLTAFSERVNDFADSLRQHENLSWLQGDEQ